MTLFSSFVVGSQKITFMWKNAADFCSNKQGVFQVEVGHYHYVLPPCSFYKVLGNELLKGSSKIPALKSLLAQTSKLPWTNGPG